MQIHIGVLEEIDFEFVKLRDKNGKIRNLKIANIEIMDDDEIFKWKIANEKINKASISCIFPSDSDAEIIKDTLSTIRNMTNVEIQDVYDGPQIGEKEISYTFKVESFDSNAIKKAKDTLKGFGGKIR